LLKSLSKKELETVQEMILSGKRKSLIPLFKELKRYKAKETAPDRAELYRKIFGKPYSKGKDYLLRNELRLLNDIIYELMVMESLKEHMTKNKSLFNRWLAQSFHDRRMPIFAEDVSEFLNYAKEHVHLDEASAMFALRSAWASSFPINSKERDREKAFEQVKEWKYEEERRFLHRQRKIEFSLIFFEKFMKDARPPAPPEIEDWSTPGATVFDLTDIDSNDWYTRYLTLQKYYTQSKGNMQLNYLREMIKLISSSEGKLVVKPDSRVRSIEALVTNLFMNNRYEEAHVYMPEALKLSKTDGKDISPSYIVICISNLLMLGKFQEGIAFYEEYEGLVNLSVSRSHGIVVTAYCYLFLEKPDEALQMLKHGIELQPVEVLQGRYIYLIAFVLRKQYDLATTEIKNMKRMLSNTSFASSEHERIVMGYFNAYLRTVSGPDSGGEKQLAKLKVDIGGYLNNKKGNPLETLQLKWLLEHLN
jgi:hypothetical protein